MISSRSEISIAVLIEVPNMSEKSLAMSSVAAAVICGTFFLPPTPVALAASRVQLPAILNVVSLVPATATPALKTNAAVQKLGAPAIADAGNTAGKMAATRAWTNPIAAVSR
jgi:hypothetical protein